MGQSVEREIEHSVEEITDLCSWMTEGDIGRFRRMLYASFEVDAGSDESMGVVVEELYALWQRSVQVGDRRGEEYHWPPMPADIACLP